MTDIEVLSKLIQDSNIGGWIGGIFSIIILLIIIKKYIFNGFGVTITTLIKDYLTLEETRVATLTKTEKDIHDLITELKRITEFILQDRETYSTRIGNVETRIDNIKTTLIQEIQEVDTKVCHIHKTSMDILHNIEKRGNPQNEVCEEMPA